MSKHMHGFWLFENDGRLDEEQQEEDHQNELCRLMEMYQTYHDITLTKQYVLRASRMTCQYGTKPALLDIQEDHGVYMGNIPVMTCLDCHRTNIHNFGSCVCPETMYEKRLPMTPPVHPNGERAVRAPWNRYPHICIPLVSKDGWQQEKDEGMIEDSGQVSPALVDSAILTCRYGGRITIEGMPEVKEEEDEDVSSNYGIDYELNEDEKFFIAVVAGESIGQGELAWKVVANVIMNRVGSAEWTDYVTPREVMEKEGQFSCLKEGLDKEYKKAVEYLENRVDDGGTYEQLISAVMPIYHEEEKDVTGGAQLYYSPKSMKPPGSVPYWASKYKEITVDGINPNDFVLFTGERID